MSSWLLNEFELKDTDNNTAVINTVKKFMVFILIEFKIYKINLKLNK